MRIIKYPECWEKQGHQLHVETSNYVEELDWDQIPRYGEDDVPKASEDMEYYITDENGNAVWSEIVREGEDYAFTD